MSNICFCLFSRRPYSLNPTKQIFFFSSNSFTAPQNESNPPENKLTQSNSLFFTKLNLLTLFPLNFSRVLLKLNFHTSPLKNPNVFSKSYFTLFHFSKSNTGIFTSIYLVHPSLKTLLGILLSIAYTLKDIIIKSSFILGMVFTPNLLHKFSISVLIFE